jgi:hypothetical protein
LLDAETDATRHGQGEKKEYPQPWGSNTTSAGTRTARITGTGFTHHGAQGGEVWEMLARPGMLECMRNAECHAARGGRERSQCLEIRSCCAGVGLTGSHRAVGFRACDDPGHSACHQWLPGAWPRGTCLPRKRRPRENAKHRPNSGTFAAGTTAQTMASSTTMIVRHLVARRGMSGRWTQFVYV